MPAATEALELSLCVDCIAMDANGEMGRCMCETGEAPECEDAVHAAKMTARGMDDLLIGPADTESEGYFSWSRCDGCGSTLGGTRFDYVAVPT